MILGRAFTSVFVVLAASVASADETSDQKDIRRVIKLLNEGYSRSDVRAISRLFTTNADLRTASGVIAVGIAAIEKALEKRAVWSEVTPPRIEDESIRFIASDVALVDAVQSQYGSTILKRMAPVILVMKRDGGEWRIASFRNLGDHFRTDSQPPF